MSLLPRHLVSIAAVAAFTVLAFGSDSDSDTTSADVRSDMDRTMQADANPPRLQPAGEPASIYGSMPADTLYGQMITAPQADSLYGQAIDAEASMYGSAPR